MSDMLNISRNEFSLAGRIVAAEADGGASPQRMRIRVTLAQQGYILPIENGGVAEPRPATEWLRVEWSGSEAARFLLDWQAETVSEDNRRRIPWVNAVIQGRIRQRVWLDQEGKAQNGAIVLEALRVDLDWRDPLTKDEISAWEETHKRSADAFAQRMGRQGSTQDVTPERSSPRKNRANSRQNRPNRPNLAPNAQENTTPPDFDDEIQI